MTNREAYKDKLDDLLARITAVVDGEPVRCGSSSCKRCLFRERCGKPERKKKIIDWLNAEYQEPPVDWSKVPIDTKVLFTDCEGNEHKGYFAGVEETCLTVWKYGTASWTADGERMVSTHVRLAEGNE